MRLRNDIISAGLWQGAREPECYATPHLFEGTRPQVTTAGEQTTEMASRWMSAYMPIHANPALKNTNQAFLDKSHKHTGPSTAVSCTNMT